MLLESFHVFPGSKGIQGQAQSLRRGKGFRRYLLWEVTYKWNMPWRIFAVAGFISAKSTPNWFSGLPENCGTAVNSREACTWLSSPLYIILQLWRIQFYQISNVCLISNACAFGQAQQDICGLWCRPSDLATLMLLVFDMSWRRPLESTKQMNIKGTSNEHQWRLTCCILWFSGDPFKTRTISEKGRAVQWRHPQVMPMSKISVHKCASCSSQLHVVDLRIIWTLSNNPICCLSMPIDAYLPCISEQWDPDFW